MASQVTISRKAIILAILLVALVVFAAQMSLRQQRQERYDAVPLPADIHLQAGEAYTYDGVGFVVPSKATARITFQKAADDGGKVRFYMLAFVYPDESDDAISINTDMMPAYESVASFATSDSRAGNGDEKRRDAESVCAIMTEVGEASEVALGNARFTRCVVSDDASGQSVCYYLPHGDNELLGIQLLVDTYDASTADLVNIEALDASDTARELYANIYVMQ